MDIMLERILYLIKENGWSISEFERRLGKSTGTVNGWKTSKSSPRKHLPQIAEILGTTEAYLLGETDISRPKGAAPARDDVSYDVRILSRSIDKIKRNDPKSFAIIKTLVESMADAESDGFDENI